MPLFSFLSLKSFSQKHLLFLPRWRALEMVLQKGWPGCHPTNLWNCPSSPLKNLSHDIHMALGLHYWRWSPAFSRGSWPGDLWPALAGDPVCELRCPGNTDLQPSLLIIRVLWHALLGRLPPKVAREMTLLQKEVADTTKNVYLMDALKNVYLMDAMAIFANGLQDSSQFGLCQCA